MPVFNFQQIESVAVDYMTQCFVEEKCLPDWDLCIERILNETPLYYAGSRTVVRRLLRDPDKFGELMSRAWAEFTAKTVA